MSIRRKTFNGLEWEADVDITDMPLHVNTCGEDIFENNKNRKVDTVFRPLGRKDFQFVYVKKGYIELYKNNVMEKIYENNILLFKPGEPQHYIFTKDGNANTLWIHFSGYNAGYLLDDYGITESVIPVTTLFPEFENTVNKLLKNMNCDELSKYTCASLLNILMVDISRMHNKEKYRDKEHLKTLDKVKNIMEQTATQNFSIEYYAEKCNVSVEHFIRMFNKAYSMSPKQYLIKLRIENAIILLRDTNLSIYEIAEKTGFTSEYYFSRIFKKNVFISPSAFRKSLINSSKNKAN